MYLLPETQRKIRRWHHKDGLSIKGIARKASLSRNTVRKCLRAEEITSTHPAGRPSTLAEHKDLIKGWLLAEKSRKGKGKLTADTIRRRLAEIGVFLDVSTVSRFTKKLKAELEMLNAEVFIPLSFEPGEAFQFDWATYQKAEIGGVTMQVKLAHFSLAHSRMPFVIPYARESAEMLFDAHAKAFLFYEGVPSRGVYDNPKTIVEKVLLGKDRKFNLKAAKLFDHYKYEPTACTPAKGNEKGRVEKQVQDFRNSLLEEVIADKLRGTSFEELAITLQESCIKIAKRKKHPEVKDKSVWEVFLAEKEVLTPVISSFDCGVAEQRSVSHLSLIKVDRNAYSVPAHLAGHSITVYIYAGKIRCFHDGKFVYEHKRRFTRDRSYFDPMHYLSVLDKKPGALRNGQPFKEGNLPQSMYEVSRRLIKIDRGDRDFVEILSAAKEHGIEAVEVACEMSLDQGVVTKDFIMNHIHRLIDQSPSSIEVQLPSGLELIEEPQPDIQKYDQIISTSGSDLIG